MGNQQREAVEHRSARIEEFAVKLVQLVTNGELVSNVKTKAVE